MYSCTPIEMQILNARQHVRRALCRRCPGTNMAKQAQASPVDVFSGSGCAVSDTALHHSSLKPGNPGCSPTQRALLLRRGLADRYPRVAATAQASPCLFIWQPQATLEPCAGLPPAAGLLWYSA